jgi:hypothetical protein
MNLMSVVKESFTITGRGIIVELQHNLNGLPSGTMLFNETTG